MKDLLEQFNQDGYLVLEDFLSEDEVNELKTAGVELTGDIPEDCRTVFSTTDEMQKLSKDRYFIESGDKIRYFFEPGALGDDGKLLVDSSIALNKVGHALHWLHPVFKKYTINNKVRETCWQLGLQEPVIPQSMYIYKNPGIGSEVISHQDATYLHTEPVSAVGFWIALDDATVQNGCLWFAPGSHKSGVHRRFIRSKDNTSGQLLEYDKPAPLYPSNNFTAVPVKKGTCVLIHGQVVHRSELNKSEKSRHAYTFHVVESKDVKYSEDNWLQPTENLPFPKLYARNSS